MSFSKNTIEKTNKLLVITKLKAKEINVKEAFRQVNMLENEVNNAI